MGLIRIPLIELGWEGPVSLHLLRRVCESAENFDHARAVVAVRSKARYHPEGAGVDATGTWHEGRAHYPGRPVVLPPATGVLPPPQGVGMERQESAEAVVVGNTAR